MSQGADPRGQQDENNQAFLSFYDDNLEINYIWDGRASYIQMQQGGAGEPVYGIVESPDCTMLSLRRSISEFTVTCRARSKLVEEYLRQQYEQADTEPPNRYLPAEIQHAIHHLSDS